MNVVDFEIDVASSQNDLRKIIINNHESLIYM